jgi:hypothetical protein
MRYRDALKDFDMVYLTAVAAMAWHGLWHMYGV